jgi:nucleoside-diphosphate-sugar epimerase
MYGLGKLTSEGIFYALNQSGCASVSIARLFTFVGPLMPLDAHFAIGNFMSAALRGDAIRMNSRGNAVRSWMHLQDLARYLLLLSASRRSSIVDIGEEASMTIAEAAQLVAEIANVGVEFGTEENPSGSSMRYLPDLRALWSLGPRLLTKSHLESFEDTYRWLKSSNNFA